MAGSNGESPGASAAEPASAVWRLSYLVAEARLDHLDVAADQNGDGRLARLDIATTVYEALRNEPFAALREISRDPAVKDGNRHRAAEIAELGLKVAGAAAASGSGRGSLD